MRTLYVYQILVCINGLCVVVRLCKYFMFCIVFYVMNTYLENWNFIHVVKYAMLDYMVVHNTSDAFIHGVHDMGYIKYIEKLHWSYKCICNTYDAFIHGRTLTRHSSYVVQQLLVA
jgi:hypothetical protein